ncbi:MAG: right-handed parallel beta-helix repeat-containing protein [Phycisphaerales bacterium]|nr:MAG: right-handed parallel beta-helix repeat-containing protein [Phycisphaerales bacterium]
MSSCAFSENRPGTGGWQQCTVKQRSTPPGVGGSMLLVSSTLIAKSCTFTASETNGFGNTAIYATGSNAINLEKCSFFGRGRIVGGTPIITQGPVGAFDCVFTGCRSSNGYVIDGAATFPQSGSAVKAGAGSSFRNCTFVDNRIGIFAPGTPLPTVDPALGCLDAPGAIVKNCIFSNNVGFGYTTISNHVGKVGTVTSSCIDTLDEFPPATILFTDPRFVDPDGPNGIPGDADDDYRLSPGSPCIDAGNNAAYPITSSTTDLLGNPRFLDDAYTVDTGLGAAPLIDIGAIEFVQTLPVCVADVDNGQGEGQRDGAVTVDDLIFYLAYFNIGAHQTDVDDGSGTGTPDGAVTIDDLLYYLIRFNAGC